MRVASATDGVSSRGTAMLSGGGSGPARAAGLAPDARGELWMAKSLPNERRPPKRSSPLACRAQTTALWKGASCCGAA
jgi:hypothetical protein